ncbi:MAG: type II secretion system F family protein [Hyphomicrobiaceae bacterium]|nr:type II secretion system F family protein [Hyphomicrobiaceae bacterium]
MPVFAYRALTLSGDSRQGQESADTEEHLRDLLAGRDLILKTAKAARTQGLARGAKIPLKHLAAFNRQFVVLLQAGITIPQSLSILMSRPHQPRLEAALRLLLEEVKRGLSLSQAADKQASAFEAPYRAVIATGERAGALADCLARYQAYIDLRLRIGAQVSKALIYPIVLLLTLAAVLVFLFLAVIPNFVAMYADLGSALPVPTQILVAVADNFHVIAATVVLGVAGLYAADRVWTATADGAAARDAAFMKLPVAGTFRRAEAAAQSTRILSTLILSGTPAAEALAVASTSVTDRAFARCLARANTALHEGRSLSDALAAEALLPAESLKMLAAGEASGSLGPMLADIARYHESELEQGLTRLTGLAEPILILVAGLVVGGIIVAMYLPIFSLTELIK